MRTPLYAAILALLAATAPAHAAVIYDFGSLGFSFRYVSPDFITGGRIVPATDLSSRTDNIDQVDFRPACPDAGFGACDEIRTQNFAQSSNSFFFFPDGSFTADGTYPQAFGLFPSTLIVSGTPDTPAPVPEPASLFLLALAPLAAAIRRRRA